MGCAGCGADVVEGRAGIPMYEDSVLPNDWLGEWFGREACSRCCAIQAILIAPVPVAYFASKDVPHQNGGVMGEREPIETWSDSDMVKCAWCRKPIGPMRVADFLGTDRLEKRCGHCDKPITILGVVKATYRCQAR